MDLSYILNELGEERSLPVNAVAPPIYQSSNFCFPDVGTMRESLCREMDVSFYTRGNNPTVEILRKKLAALEGTEEALVFGSGSAAVAAAVMSSVQAGDHVVCVAKPYSWTHKLLTQLLARFGVESTFIPGQDPQEWEDAIQPNTRLFFLESPNSHTYEMQDLAAVASIAKAHGLITAIDNSYATPLNQRPCADFGIDISVHSASKYLTGHSDVVAGVLCCSRERAEHIFKGEYMTLGGIISPHDAWLMIRGLRTLHLRMDWVAKSTPKIVQYLEEHPKVRKVYYPFSPSNPQYDLAKKQMKAPAGLFSVELETESLEEVERFCNALQRFLLACSWGGHESLIFPQCVLQSSMNYSGGPLGFNFIRFYAGLEETEVLIADLEQAFQQM